MYEREKELTTKIELQKLIKSKAYLEYMKRKNNGEIKPVELTEDDKIQFSDEE